jgi:hypothetical protein
MTNPVPDAKAKLSDDIVVALGGIPGLVAIALGGSHARGTHTPDSDLDLGLYYREAEPFAIADIERIARRFSQSGKPTVCGFYEWGPFVNGGAWIDNATSKVDFLYRNLDQLERTLRDAEAGKWEHSFDQQPPFGYRTVTTLGEISCCKPLFDPKGELAALKARVQTFPPALKTHIVQSALWAAEFSFTFAETFVRDGDVPNAVGCLTRIFHYLVHALFALNDAYLVNEKREAREIAGFTLCPQDFYARASAILGAPGRTSEELKRSIDEMHTLWRETAALTKGAYRSRYAL